MTTTIALDFDALWREHHAEIERYMRTRAAGHADDLASETWARAIAGAHTYRPDAGTPEGWLYGIAGRVVADHYRTAARRPHEVAEVQDWDAVDPADVAVEACDRVLAGQVLAAVPEAQREVVARRYLADESIASTAVDVGVKPGTVKSQCSRAIAVLRTAFGVVAPIADRPTVPPAAGPNPTLAPQPQEDTGAPAAPTAVAQPGRARTAGRHHRRGHRGAARRPLARRAPVPRGTRPPAGRHRGRPAPATRPDTAPAPGPALRHRPAGARLAHDPTRPPLTQGDLPMIPLPDWAFGVGWAFIVLALTAFGWLAWLARTTPRVVSRSRHVLDTCDTIAHYVVADRILRTGEDPDAADRSVEPATPATPATPAPPRFTGFPPAPSTGGRRGKHEAPDEPAPAPEWHTEFTEQFPAFASILRETYERVGAR